MITSWKPHRTKKPFKTTLKTLKMGKSLKWATIQQSENKILA